MEEMSLARGGRRLSFWALAATVFMANALLSIARSEWVLATLQAMTAVLAALAAIEEWTALRRQRH